MQAQPRSVFFPPNLRFKSKTLQPPVHKHELFRDEEQILGNWRKWSNYNIWLKEIIFTSIFNQFPRRSREVFSIFSGITEPLHKVKGYFETFLSKQEVSTFLTSCKLKDANRTYIIIYNAHTACNTRYHPDFIESTFLIKVKRNGKNSFARSDSAGMQRASVAATVDGTRRDDWWETCLEYRVRSPVRTVVVRSEITGPRLYSGSGRDGSTAESQILGRYSEVSLAARIHTRWRGAHARPLKYRKMCRYAEELSPHLTKDAIETC